jgi:hypothetical protein
MMHPVAFDGQLTGGIVTAFPETLTKNRSVVPLKNSAIGEQAAFAVLKDGPTIELFMTPAVTGTSQSAVTAPLVLQTIKSPVPSELL